MKHRKVDITGKGLIQKEKVNIDGEKSAQSSILAKTTNTKMTPDYDYHVHIMLLI